MNTLITLAVLVAAVAAQSPKEIWYSGCGYSQYSNAGIPDGARVVGGEPSMKHEFPWMASMRRGLVGSSHFCGGVIIHPSWILTAAHCVTSYGDTEVQVEAGDHDRGMLDDDQRQFRMSQRLFIHEEYGLVSSYDSDIALVQLDTPFNFTENVTAVCAPDPNESYTNQTAQVVGWGALFSGGPSPELLHWTQVNVVSNEECSLPSHYPGQITGTMICAGGGDDFTATDTCQGDSGGPMSTKQSDNRFDVIGLVSWGRGCADGSPGVYARTGVFVDWIKNKMDNHPN